MIILDIGSGSNADLMPKMIDAVREIDTGKHDIVFKAQLFTDQPPNIVLTDDEFRRVYEHAGEKGYECTASVFDMDAIQFLLEGEFSVPFVKIACRPDLYHLIDEIPRGTRVYASMYKEWAPSADTRLFCVPKYPAQRDEYRSHLMRTQSFEGISDHTVGLNLYHETRPEIYECHIRLPESEGPDAGPWAKLPSELEAIL